MAEQGIAVVATPQEIQEAATTATLAAYLEALRTLYPSTDQRISSDDP